MLRIVTIHQRLAVNEVVTDAWCRRVYIWLTHGGLLTNPFYNKTTTSLIYCTTFHCHSSPDRPSAIVKIATFSEIGCIEMTLRCDAKRRWRERDGEEDPGNVDSTTPAATGRNVNLVCLSLSLDHFYAQCKEP